LVNREGQQFGVSSGCLAVRKAVRIEVKDVPGQVGRTGHDLAFGARSLPGWSSQVAGGSPRHHLLNQSPELVYASTMNGR
jgi:hypothetical protein